MEQVDILDEKGNPTGEVKLKSEAHRDGDWHRAVHVWIVNTKGELLIQRRAAIKENHPNMWDIPSAGHVSAGETAITSAVRETEEELGLKLEEEDFEYLFTVTQKSVTNNGTFINNEFNDVYLVRRDVDITQLVLQEEEVAEVRFILWKELRNILDEEGGDFVRHPEEYKKLFEYLENTNKKQ